MAESYQRLEKWSLLFPCLAFSTLGKSRGVKLTVLPGGLPLTVTFTVLAQLCGPKANEAEMGATLFTRSGEGRDFDLLALERDVRPAGRPPTIAFTLLVHVGRPKGINEAVVPPSLPKRRT